MSEAWSMFSCCGFLKPAVTLRMNSYLRKIVLHVPLVICIIFPTEFRFLGFFNPIAFISLTLSLCRSSTTLGGTRFFYCRRLRTLLCFFFLAGFELCWIHLILGFTSICGSRSLFLSRLGCCFTDFGGSTFIWELAIYWIRVPELCWYLLASSSGCHSLGPYNNSNGL